MHTRSRKKFIRGVICVTIVTTAVTTLLTMPACTGETYASAADKSPPYIHKEGCTFSIVGENGRSSITSLEVTGAPEEAFSASISFGEYSITVSACALVENSHGLPVYED